MSYIADLFGYVLNYIYMFVQNYGVAIILFSILLKIVLLPLTINQQKTMKKTAKIQEKMKEIQDKYKNNPERLNQETMDLYKREKMNPFSGCFSAIIQIVILLSMFWLVRSPLTHMKKVDPTIIENYTNEINQEAEANGERKSAYPEIQIIRTKGEQDEQVRINMDFLGLDLSNIPTQALTDPTVYIIPVLYVISSIISMKFTASMTGKKEENKNKDEKDELDAVAQANKNMTYLMPVMAVSVSFVAPLGLALYWLVNNILIIIEKLILNKFMHSKEDEENA